MKQLYAFAFYRSFYRFWLLLAVIPMSMLMYADVDYLCFTAGEASVNIKMNRIGTPSVNFTFQYSTDNGVSWTDMTVIKGTGEVQICTLGSIGDKVLLRGKNTTANGIGSCNTGSYCSYKFVITKKVTLSGNIMSLIDYENEVLTLPCDYCFNNLFVSCTGITSAEELVLPATTLKKGCYEKMFDGCTNMVTPPASLPAITLSAFCYDMMFQGCSKLTSAPDMPATTLAEGCYLKMFNNCIALTTAPSLPITTLATQCYNYMFGGCIALTTAPELPATTLTSKCYINMFNGCTALTTAPDLPATTLATDCYNGMFNGCTSLVNAPAELPATILLERCYKSMFKGCTSLVNAPIIMATSLPVNNTADAGCMEYMFQNCSALSRLEVRFTAWDSGTVHNNNKNATYYWLNGTTKNSSCKFICSCDLPDANRGDNRIQTNWTRSTINTYVFDVATTVGTWDGSDNANRTHERITGDAATNLTTLPTAQKSGYVFMGWNTNTDGSGTTLTIDNQTDYTCSNTFYAQFAPQYTFCVNGGSWDGSDTDNRVLTNPVVSVSDPILDGYTFLGWNTAVDGSGEAWDIDHQPATPQTYYAQWEEIVPTILELDDNVDNTALLTENTGNTLAVRLVGRTLVGGTTNTLCLPFSMTAEQLDDSPLAGSTIWTFDRATATEEMLTVEMTPADAITAGVPYLIEPLTNIAEPVFEGVTISAVNGSKTGDSDVRFVGVMIPTLLEAGNKNQLFLTAGNMLQTPSVSNYMRGYRAYFLLNDAASMPARARVAFHRDRPMPTDIKDTYKCDTQVKKMMIDGVMYIKRGNKLYNISGTEVPLN